MAPLASLWTRIICVFDFLTNSPWHPHVFGHDPALQIPVQDYSKHYPIFEPPNVPESDTFVCEYPSLRGWKSCSTHNDRGCWLKGPDGQNFTIHTDYEKHHPEGILRKYYLEVANHTISPDGVPFNQAKLFNASYPGPWIQACWGDTIEITVKNKLTTNGTTIHWHGIRQLHSTEMDGVNGVTQCPIAPGESFTYRFKALQYGTSWYHSHYSLQVCFGQDLMFPECR